MAVSQVMAAPRPCKCTCQTAALPTNSIHALLWLTACLEALHYVGGQPPTVSVQHAPALPLRLACAAMPTPCRRPPPHPHCSPLVYLCKILLPGTWFMTWYKLLWGVRCAFLPRPLGTAWGMQLTMAGGLWLGWWAVNKVLAQPREAEAEGVERRGEGRGRSESRRERGATFSRGRRPEIRLNDTASSDGESQPHRCHAWAAAL